MIPEVVYLAAYMCIQDNIIFDKEWLKIKEYIKKYNFNICVEKEVIKVLGDKDDKILLEDILDELRRLDKESKKEAIEIAVTIAYQDEKIVNDEKCFLEYIRNELDINKTTLKKIYSNVRKKFLEEISKGIKDKNNLDSLLERNNFLVFNDKRYEKIVEKMNGVARGDIKYSKKIIGNVLESMNKFGENFNEQIEKAIEAQQNIIMEDTDISIKDIFCGINEKLSKMLNEMQVKVEKTLERFEETSKYFTISFLGRTKAGKSTLHSIMLGGENKEFIGKGCERTTRYNYIYEWNKIRIIDTPGIGAPGGKTDEEIAESVIDESDIICYLVTTDSIQLTEFDFLRKIKDRNKPVIILLNKKENFFRTEKSKKRFIEDPLQWYHDEDFIKGHINRIEQYICEKYQNKNIQIIPVHLLAARIAFDEKDEQLQYKLLDGSRIKVFFEELKKQIIEYGVLKRSHTILGGARHYLGKYNKELTIESKNLEEYKNAIGRKSTEVNEKLVEIGENYKKSLVEGINNLFNMFISKELQWFVNNYYDESKKTIKKEWEDYIKKSGLELNLKNYIKQTIDNYCDEVEQILRELNEDFEFEINIGGGINIETSSIFDIKSFVQIVGAVVGLISYFIVLFNPLLGWIGVGVSTIATVVSFFMKSKKDKIQEAKDKLYKTLKDSLDEVNVKIGNSVVDAFIEENKNNIAVVNEHLNCIKNGLDIIKKEIEKISNIEYSEYERINKRFAARILNFAYGKNVVNMRGYREYKDFKIEHYMGERFVIKFKKFYEYDIKYNSDDLMKILQEKIIICGDEE